MGLSGVATTKVLNRISNREVRDSLMAGFGEACGVITYCSNNDVFFSVFFLSLSLSLFMCVSRTRA